MALLIRDELDSSRHNAHYTAEIRQYIRWSKRFKQLKSGQHGGKDHERRHHIEAKEIDNMDVITQLRVSRQPQYQEAISSRMTDTDHISV